MHATYRTLRDEGRFDEPVAEALVKAMSGMLAASLDDLATQSQIGRVEADLRAEIHAVKADLEQLRLATKAGLEQLRLATKADLAEVKADLRLDIQAVRTELRAERGWLLASVITIISAMAVMLQFMR
ncbi:MAG: coiled-coil domain-containing protein [Nitrospirota bacterium]